ALGAGSGLTAHSRAAELAFGETVGDDLTAPRAPDAPAEPLVLDNYFKPYPACRWVHPALAAAEALLDENAIAAGAIERVEVSTYPIAAQLDDPHPANLLQSRFSIPWAFAVRATAGRIDWETLDRAALADPVVHALAERVVVIADPSFEATRGA